jgi:hypothetical protein
LAAAVIPDAAQRQSGVHMAVRVARWMPALRVG